jgi:sulfate adenylyltransferase subunit 2
MLYSIGKDSSVMLHLARKAFFPGKPPFPLLHIDTGRKFSEMIAFRDETARRLGLDLSWTFCPRKEPNNAMQGEDGCLASHPLERVHGRKVRRRTQRARAAIITKR